MSAEIGPHDGAQIHLVAGGGGVFDVRVDGSLLFSKHKLGRFPEPGEIARLIAASRQA